MTTNVSKPSNSNHHTISTLAISQNYEQVATGSVSGIIEIRDLSTWTLYGRLNGPSHEVDYIAFSQDGRKLATIQGRQLLLWDLTILESNDMLELEYSLADVLHKDEYLSRVEFSPNGNKFVGFLYGHSAFLLWDLKDVLQKGTTPKFNLQNLRPTDSCDQIVFSSDGKKLLYEGYYCINAFDIEDCEDSVIMQFQSPRDVSSFAISSDSKFLAVSGSGILEIFDCDSGKLIYAVPFDTIRYPMNIRFSSTNEFIDTPRGRIKLPDKSVGEDLLSIPGWILRYGWFEWKGQRILRVPSDFADGYWVCDGNTFVAVVEGRCMLIELDSRGPQLDQDLDKGKARA